ncbi:MAG TPA: T9SS type A sorting domain-containing protein [Cyclobacteriaceae bacterium]|nr:T9SS type A sorting domain-containing protein [Cyclobacteriaceae bacterium]
MRNIVSLVIGLLLASLVANAQTTGDFRSHATGNWNSVNTWERWNGSSWIFPAPSTPTDADGVITIQVSHTVTIPSGFSVAADQLTLAANNATNLVIASGGTLSLSDGTGTDLTFSTGLGTCKLSVSGTFTVNQGATIANATTARLLMLNGGVYQHNYTTTPGQIYTANWATGSTLEFIGYTDITGAPTGLGQSFYNVRWNCPNQGSVSAGNIDLDGKLTTVKGDLTIDDTGVTYLIFSDATSYTLNVTGNIVANNAASFTFSAFSAITANVNVTGNFTYNSSTANSFIAFTGDVNLTVNGNFVINNLSGGIDLSGDVGVANVNVKGNFSITQGSLVKTGPASGNAFINFNGTTVQTFTNTGNPIIEDISFVVVSPAILDLGSQVLDGTGSFSLQSGSTLKVGSSVGLSNSVTGTGNIQVTGTRTYSAGGIIVYNGTTQSLGNEWTGLLSSAGVNLEIASSGTTTNNNSSTTISVAGLTLTSGTLALGNSNTYQLSGYIRTAGNISGTSTSSLTFTGGGTLSGNLVLAPGFQNLNNLSMSRTGTVTLGSDLNIQGTLAFTSTGNVDINGQTLNIVGNITQSGGGGLVSSLTTSNLTVAGSGALSSFGFASPMQLNNVQLLRTSGTYSWNAAGNVNGTITLANGSLTLGTNTLIMVVGSTFSRIGGTTVTGVTSATSGIYNVSYSGNLTTSGELPTAVSGQLGALTIGGNVTLDKAIDINGDLVINSGSLSAGTNNITMSGVNFTINGGTFTVSSGQLTTFDSGVSTTWGGSSLSGVQFSNATVNPGTTIIVSGTNPNINVSGTWDNNGALTPGSSTFIFNGAAQSIDTNGQPFFSVTMGGTGIKTLGQALDTHGSLTINTGVTLDVGVNRTITCGGSWINNGTFNANNGLVIFDGTGQSINAAGQAFYDLQLSTNGTTKTLSGAIDINHNLTIDAGVTFDVSAIAYPINLAGNWINNGTFTRRTGTVIFDGTTVISGTTAPSFNNVTISGTALTLPSGVTTDVSGNWNQSAGTLTATGSTLQFSGGSQTIAPGGQTFNNVTINGAGTKTLTGSGTVGGVLTLTAGTFDASGQTLNLQGNFVSNSASILTTSTLTFSGTTVLSGSVNPTFGSITVTGSFSPAASFNINGNLVNNGTLNASAGTVTFGGSTAISGTNASTFNNVIISGTLTAPSANMNVAGSWTNNGTFTHNSGTVTFTGTTSVAGSNPSNFNHITISGTLNGPASLNVAGNFTNNGVFNRGTGTVVFNGTGTQSITGSTVTDFNNITVSNNSNAPAVQVLTNQNLRGVLTLSGTNTVFDADGAGSAVFKIMSTGDSPTSDGGIATLPSGTSVSGQVTVQRYMSIEGANSGRIFRYISSPVQNAPVSQLQAFIPVTGTFTGSSTCSGCSTNASMQYYNETVTTDTNGSGIADLNDGYINYPVAANSETMATAVGYKVFVRGNIAPVSTAGSALWELRGSVNAGNITLPASFTSSGTLANDGWNLVGNPYPSTIDWNAGGWTKTNISNTFYMLDNGLAIPVFASYNGTVGTNGGSRFIAAGQAFWVKSDGPGSPTVAVTESVKVAGTSTTFFREALPANILRVTLKQGTVADEMVIQFTDNASVAFDNQLDARKLPNPTAFNLSSLSSDNVKLAINAMPMSQDCYSSIKLDVSNVPAGSYSLNFSDFETFTNSLTKIFLQDAFTGQSIDVRLSTSYAFQVTSNTASFGSDRFSIKVGEALSTISATGNTRCDAGTLTLNASGAQDGNYRWFTDAAGTLPISGATSSTLITGTLTKSTSFYVAAANAAGCFGPRTEVLATIVGDIPSTLTAVNASRCGAGSVTLGANGASAVDGYRWYTSQTGGTAIPGATSATFITPSLDQKTNYYVTSIAAGGCEQVRIPVVAGISILTPVEITVNGDLLQSSYTQGNQWYKDGTLIAGATAATYQPTTTGVYKVVVTIDGCTTTVEKQYVVTGLGEGLPSHIIVSPVPTSSLVTVSVESDYQVSAQVVSMSGTRIFEKELEGDRIKRGVFNLQDQSDGMYILVVVDGNNIYKTRIIKK